MYQNVSNLKRSVQGASANSSQKKTNKPKQPLQKQSDQESYIDPISFIQKFLSESGYTIQANGNVVDQTGSSLRDLDSELQLYAYNSDQKIKESILEPALKVLIKLTKEKERKAIVADISKFVPDPNNTLKEYLIALTGLDLNKPDEKYEFENSKFCFEHFIRQVKRKMLGLSDFQELMVIILGNQNQGKTTWVRKLLSPLRHLSDERGLQDISNIEKNCYIFEDNFVILCEEMQNPDKASMETLKWLITTPDVGARKFHSQTQFKLKKNSILIGTSNKSTSEWCQDTTGARRFFDIETRIKKCDFDAINQIDILALWHSVNPELTDKEMDEFYAFYKERIAPVQENARPKDSVEQFYTYFDLAIGTESIYTADLYDSYTYYCCKNGIKNPLQQPSFMKRVYKLLGHAKSPDTRNRRGRTVHLNQSREILAAPLVTEMDNNNLKKEYQKQK